MKRAWILCVLSLVILTGCGSSVGQNGASVDIEAIDREETYPDGPFSLSDHYSSVEELYEAADLVIAGVVTGVEAATGEGTGQTHSEVTVRAVLKGTEPGESVTIMEYGLGVPAVSEGEEVILFLVESSWDAYPDRYYIVGAFQGKFLLREGYYFQQATESVKLSLEQYYPKNYEEFLKILK